jgi:hypothetical protein
MYALHLGSARKKIMRSTCLKKGANEFIKIPQHESYRDVWNICNDIDFYSEVSGLCVGRVPVRFLVVFLSLPKQIPDPHLQTGQDCFIPSHHS